MGRALTVPQAAWAALWAPVWRARPGVLSAAAPQAQRLASGQGPWVRPQVPGPGRDPTCPQGPRLPRSACVPGLAAAAVGPGLLSGNPAGLLRGHWRWSRGGGPGLSTQPAGEREEWAFSGAPPIWYVGRSGHPTPPPGRAPPRLQRDARGSPATACFCHYKDQLLLDPTETRDIYSLYLTSLVNIFSPHWSICNP